MCRVSTAHSRNHSAAGGFVLIGESLFAVSEQFLRARNFPASNVRLPRPGNIRDTSELSSQPSTPKFSIHPITIDLPRGPCCPVHSRKHFRNSLSLTSGPPTAWQRFPNGFLKLEFLLIDMTFPMPLHSELLWPCYWRSYNYRSICFLRLNGWASFLTTKQPLKETFEVP